MGIKSIGISNIFVKKIVEKGTMIVHKNELLKIWLKSGGSESRISFAINLLKNQKKILKITKDIYILNPESENIDNIYWEIIAKIISTFSDYPAIITGDKALELHMMNNFPPEKLTLCTFDFTARIKLFDGREIYMRPLKTGEKTFGKNFYNILKKNSQKFGNFKKILLPNKEISLLEALSINSYENGIYENLVLQFLPRNAKNLDFDVLHEIANFGYIRAINRLRQIAKYNGYEKLYLETLEIIKSEGGGIFLSL